MDKLDKHINDSVKRLDTIKTPSCLDITTIGMYVENTLSAEARTKAEGHICSCLYCLGQAAEMREMLYVDTDAFPVSPELEQKLIQLAPSRKKKLTIKNFAERFFVKVKEVSSYPFIQWRYSAVSLASICVTVLITYAFLKPEAPSNSQPTVNRDSFVKVSAIGSDGGILNEAQGIVVGSNGLIASNLNQLAGATSIQIKLRDGSSYTTHKVWKDENKNLAVMKIDKDALPPVQLADVKDVNIGEYAYLLVDVDHPAKGYKTAVISDFKMYPGRRKGDELQYVQFATLTTTTKKGALVDKNGKVIGLLLTQEKNINLAVPIQDVEKMIKGQKAVPVSDLKDTKQTSEALHYYVQAIFAEDAQKLDQAIDLYRRAIEINPDLESAHLALGPIYYRKQLYEEEAKEYEAVLRVNPNNPDALASYAASLETRGFYKQAIEVYKRAIAADPEEQSNYYNLGIAYIADGQPKKAMELHPQLKAMSPGDAELLRRLATGGK